MNKGVKIGIVATVIAGVGAYLYSQYRAMQDICYSVGRVQIKSASATSVALAMDFIIKNLGKLKAEVLSLQLDVYAKGRLITQINQEAPVEINPLSSSSVPMTVSLNPQQLLGDVGSILLGGQYKQIPMTFKGRAKVKKFGIAFRVPFDVTYTISELMSSDGESKC